MLRCPYGAFSKLFPLSLRHNFLRCPTFHLEKAIFNIMRFRLEKSAWLSSIGTLVWRFSRREMILAKLLLNELRKKNSMPNPNSKSKKGKCLSIIMKEKTNWKCYYEKEIEIFYLQRQPNWFLGLMPAQWSEGSMLIERFTAHILSSYWGKGN